MGINRGFPAPHTVKPVHSLVILTHSWTQDKIFVWRTTGRWKPALVRIIPWTPIPTIFCCFHLFPAQMFIYRLSIVSHILRW